MDLLNYIFAVNFEIGSEETCSFTDDHSIRKTMRSTTYRQSRRLIIDFRPRQFYSVRDN